MYIYNIMTYHELKEQFWLDHFDILFKQDHILEFIPLNTYSLEKKLNALTRLLIVITI
jgi:hypothetical protein